MFNIFGQLDSTDMDDGGLAPLPSTPLPSPCTPFPCVLSVLVMGGQLAIHTTTKKYLPLLFLVTEVLDNLTESDPSTRARPIENKNTINT